MLHISNRQHAPETHLEIELLLIKARDICFGIEVQLAADNFSHTQHAASPVQLVPGGNLLEPARDDSDDEVKLAPQPNRIPIETDHIRVFEFPEGNVLTVP